MEGLRYTPKDMEFSSRPETGFAAEIENLPVVGKELAEGQYQFKAGWNDRKGEAYSREAEGLLPDQKISWDNLVAVRADWVAPKIQTTGELTVETPYTRTNGDSIRLTTHWTLNHRVAEHMEGNEWSEAPFTIISPMRSMVENNGNPLNVLSVDTFWGSDVRLPARSVIIRRGDVPGSELPNIENVTVITVGSKAEMEKAIPEVIKKLGYTNVRGGKLGSETQNFDEIVTNFAKSEGIQYTTAHANDAIETIPTSIERYFMDKDISEITSLIKNLGEIPVGLKEKIFEPLLEAINSKNFEKRLEAYGLIDEIFQEEIHSQIKKALISQLGPNWDKFLAEYSDYMETIDINGKRNTLEWFGSEIKKLESK